MDEGFGLILFDVMDFPVAIDIAAELGFPGLVDLLQLFLVVLVLTRYRNRLLFVSK